MPAADRMVQVFLGLIMVAGVVTSFWHLVGPGPLPKLTPTLLIAVGYTSMGLLSLTLPSERAARILTYRKPDGIRRYGAWILGYAAMIWVGLALQIAGSFSSRG